jgi:hypothetical protein
MRGVAGGVVLFASIVLAAAPAMAGYGAIAWDKTSGKRGASFNQPTGKRAEAAALSECGASGCKVVVRIAPSGCGALATSEDGKTAGGAARKTRDEARLAALKSCPKTAGECVVRIADCNK